MKACTTKPRAPLPPSVPRFDFTIITPMWGMTVAVCVVNDPETGYVRVRPELLRRTVHRLVGRGPFAFHHTMELQQAINDKILQHLGLCP